MLFPLAIRRRTLALTLREGGRVVRRAQADLRHEAGGELRREHVFTARAGEHGVDDLLALGLLRDEAGSTGLERLVDDPASVKAERGARALARWSG